MSASAGLGHLSKVMRVDMQISACEKRKIDIWGQMRAIEGELFLLSARSGDTTTHRQGGQKVDKLALPFDSPLENRRVISTTRGSAKPLCAGSIPARASNSLDGSHKPLSRSNLW
jgi:hypothetical protein